MPIFNNGLGATVTSDELIDLLAMYSSVDFKTDFEVKIAALLFAQPDNFTKEELLNSIEYFNARSRSSIDLYFVGYKKVVPGFSTSRSIVATVNNVDWYFSPDIFNELRKAFETKTKWQYSGSVELILFNLYSTNDKKQIQFDFSDAICIDLKKAKANNLITSSGELLEKVFSIADEISTSNPAKEMSIKLIGNTGKKSLVNILFNLLPEAIKEDTKKMYMFSTTNWNK